MASLKKYKTLKTSLEFTQGKMEEMTSTHTELEAKLKSVYRILPELCSQAVPMPVGYSDYNLIAVLRKTKMLKSGARIIQRRSFQRFDPDLF